MSTRKLRIVILLAALTLLMLLPSLASAYELIPTPGAQYNQDVIVGEEKLYRVELGRSGNVSYTVGIQQGGWVEMTFYNAAMTKKYISKRLSNSVQNNKWYVYLDYDLHLEKGIYFISIKGVSPTVYSITANYTPDRIATLESVTASAKEIKAGESIQFTMHYSGSFDDFYRVRYRIYNSDGKEVKSTEALTRTSPYSIYMTEPGTYYCEVSLWNYAGNPDTQKKKSATFTVVGEDEPAEPEEPLTLNSLTTSVKSVNVGQSVTYTANMTGSTSQIQEMEYHVYNAAGQHISGWNGISGTYTFTPTQAGTFTLRVYVKTSSGWKSVDSQPLTVVKPVEPRRVKALTPQKSSAYVGEWLSFTTEFTGESDIAWIEYHIYDQQGRHLTGYRGEGSGISGVYNYNTSSTGAGTYTARVYLMAADGTFTQVDSAPVTVINNSSTGGTRKVLALTPASTTANLGDTLTFTCIFEGSGSIAWIEYHIYDQQGRHLTGYRGEGSGVSGVYHYSTSSTGAGIYTARVYLMAADGMFTQVDSVPVQVIDPRAAAQSQTEDAEPATESVVNP